MEKRKMRKLAIGVLAAAALAGCGGGDDAATPTGLYNGSSGSRSVSTIVLGDDSYYQLYSPANNPTAVGGLVVGTGTFDGVRFASTDGRDYNLEGAGMKPATLTADVVTRSSFTGTLSSGAAAPAPFSSTYAPEIERSATLAALAGTYPGQVTFSLGARAGTFVVTPAGAFSTNINACAITGNATPRSDVNAYNLTLTFAGAPCVFPNVTFTGIARLDATGKLLGLVRNDAIAQAIVFMGTKQ
jgi:hypothetical protein